MKSAHHFPMRINKHGNSLLFFCFSIIIGLIFAKVGDCGWQPPAGIPAPSFGIDTPTYDAATHCPNWPTRQNSINHGDRYDCYYVDNSKACSDKNSGGFGTPRAPLCNIPQGGFGPGTYVDVRGGRTIPYTSTWANRFHFFGSGTSKDYIVISGKNATGGKPIINKYTHIGGEDGSTSYLIFENFETRASVDIRPTVNGYHQKHISIRSNTMRGSGFFKGGEEFVVGVDNPNAFPGTTISDIVFYNNESYDAGKWNSATEDDTCSFYVRGRASFIWVVDNVAYRSGGDGIAGGHSANRTSDHYYIGRNTLYQHRENCIDVKEINDLIISENTCHNLKTPADASANGEGIVIHYGADSLGPNSAWVLYNTIYNVVNGIQINSTNGEGYIIGNAIYNVHHDDPGWKATSPYSNGAAIRLYSMNTSFIVDNIIYDYDTGIQLPNPVSGQTYEVHGNLLSSRSAPAGYEAYVPFGQANVSFANNQFYNPDGSVRFGWGNSAQVGIGSIACRDCTEGKLALISPATDFRFKPGSPVKRKTGQHRAYAIFHKTYGTRIDKDGKD